MLFKTILTFVCFLASLVALFYFTLQGKDGGIFSALSGDDSKPQPVFYRSIGGGADEQRRVAPARRVAQVYTLELATANSKGEADLLLAKLLKNKVRAFYSEVRRGDAAIWSIRKGVFASLQDARVASRALLAELRLKNKVVELN